MRLIPETGRKHQLRRHMRHLFHHIIGDTVTAMDAIINSFVLNMVVRACCYMLRH
ncbi:hypothetical protein [Psychrobacter phenylpyruvicus]|uniref:hypothetical protein n=1 Tax=Psychrobacter phenylpyruvicus TaxID=29432 RepID=UPI0039773355